MKKPVCLFYIFALSLLTGISCSHAPVVDKNTNVTSPNIGSQTDRLIAKGNSFQNGNTDSIMAVAKQLYQLGNISKDHRALVYAQAFEANYYWKSANHELAMQKALKALSNADKWKINRVMPEIYGIIANLQKENKNFEMANKMATAGLNISKVNKDTTWIIALLGLKAMFTHSYYLTLRTPAADKTSLGLEFEALKIAESSPKYERLRIRFYNNIAQTYKDRKEYNSAINYANKAVALANKHKQPRSLTYSYSWLGESYYFMGDHSRGMDYLHKAVDITRKINEPYRQMELYESMYNCYISTQNYKEALACLNRFTTMRDSLQVNKNVKQMNEMQLKYETVKKDKQIELLDQENKAKNRGILYILITTLIFLLLVFKLWFQYITIQRNNELIKNNNLLLNQALVKIAHIQSHEIRKPLASILGLMNVIRAENYTAGKEELLMVETSSQELDEKIRDIIIQAEIKTTGIAGAKSLTKRRSRKNA